MSKKVNLGLLGIVSLGVLGGGVYYLCNGFYHQGQKANISIEKPGGSVVEIPGNSAFSPYNLNTIGDFKFSTDENNNLKCVYNDTEYMFEDLVISNLEYIPGKVSNLCTVYRADEYNTIEVWHTPYALMYIIETQLQSDKITKYVKVYDAMGIFLGNNDVNPYTLESLDGEILSLTQDITKEDGTTEIVKLGEMSFTYNADVRECIYLGENFLFDSTGSDATFMINNIKLKPKTVTTINNAGLSVDVSVSGIEYITMSIDKRTGISSVTVTQKSTLGNGTLTYRESDDGSFKVTNSNGIINQTAILKLLINKATDDIVFEYDSRVSTPVRYLKATYNDTKYVISEYTAIGCDAFDAIFYDEMMGGKFKIHYHEDTPTTLLVTYNYGTESEKSEIKTLNTMPIDVWTPVTNKVYTYGDTNYSFKNDTLTVSVVEDGTPSETIYTIENGIDTLFSSSVNINGKANYGFMVAYKNAELSKTIRIYILPDGQIYSQSIGDYFQSVQDIVDTEE